MTSCGSRPICGSSCVCESLLQQLADAERLLSGVRLALGESCQAKPREVQEPQVPLSPLEPPDLRQQGYAVEGETPPDFEVGGGSGPVETMTLQNDLPYNLLQTLSEVSAGVFYEAGSGPEAGQINELPREVRRTPPVSAFASCVGFETDAASSLGISHVLTSSHAVKKGRDRVSVSTTASAHSEGACVMASTASDSLGITEEDYWKCRRTFRSGDRDHSGYVECNELKELLEKAGGVALSEKEFTALLKKFDANSDGRLDFDEFLIAFSNLPNKACDSLERQIDNMVNKGKRDFAEGRKPIHERVRSTGVPTSVVKAYLKKELQENNACSSIPFIIFLLFFWFLSFYSHYKLPILQSAENAIAYDIVENANFAFAGEIPFSNGRFGHKSVHDVNSIADFWSWFDLGLVNLFWPEGVDVNEVASNLQVLCARPRTSLLDVGFEESLLQNLSNSVPGMCPSGPLSSPSSAGSDKPTYLFFHNIVGGVRLRQQVQPSSECRYNLWGDSSPECYHDSEHWVEPQLHHVMTFFEEELVEKTVYLKSGVSRREIRQMLRDLENQAWLDTKTAKIELLYTTYNPHEGLFMGTFIRLYFNRAGHLYKAIEPVGIWMYPFDGWFCYVCDIIWFCLVFKMLWDEAVQIYRHWKQAGFAQGMRIYIRPSSVINLLGIFYSVLMIALFIQQLMLSSEIRDYLQRADPKVVGSWANESELEGFYNLTERAAIMQYRFRSFLMAYPLVMAMRLFLAFDAQPRLAMVTRTFQRASIEIFHFGVVFFSAVFVFTISAMTMFGEAHPDFASFSRALPKVFLMLIGDFDWEALARIGLPQSMVWFWTFIILVQLVMLNMLLAIVMDVYTDVKGSVGDGAETIYSQSLELLRRWRQKRAGQRVPLDYVLSQLDPANPFGLDVSSTKETDEHYTVDSLVEHCPGLGHKQSERILTMALKEHDAQNRPQASIADATSRLVAVDHRVADMEENIARQTEISQKMSSLFINVTKDIKVHVEELQAALRAEETQASQRPKIYKQRCIAKPDNLVAVGKAFAARTREAGAAIPTFFNMCDVSRPQSVPQRTIRVPQNYSAH